MVNLNKYCLAATLILVLTGCGTQRKATYTPVETEKPAEKPVEVAKAEEITVLKVPHEQKNSRDVMVIVSYDTKVNGYDVTAEWYPYGGNSEAGPAMFHLFKNGKEMTAYCPCWVDNMLHKILISRKDRKFKEGERIRIQYNEPIEGEMLQDKCQVYFADIDFDGEDELIINSYKSGDRGANLYYAYDINDFQAVRKVAAPFNKLQNGLTSFDTKKKTIQQFEDAGKYRSRIVTYNMKTGKVSVKEESHKEE